MHRDLALWVWPGQSRGLVRNVASPLVFVQVAGCLVLP